MSEIRKVLICGIGAVGSIYANLINEYDKSNLYVLTDLARYKKYTENPQIFNGKKLVLNYVLPDTDDVKADLIIIATKYDGLGSAIENIKNFVKEDTIILSLINGIYSEEIIARKYGWKHTLISYFIGHSTMRIDNKITFDGCGKIVFGIKDKTQTEISDLDRVKNYFEKVKIPFEIQEDIMHSYWLKFMLNIVANQLSAILSMNFGQMRKNEKFLPFAKNVLKEVQQIAAAESINRWETLIDECLETFNKMLPEGKTSMLQDIESGRKTEVEIFAGAVIEFGKKYNIPTPYNQIMKELIEIAELN